MNDRLARPIHVGDTVKHTHSSLSNTTAVVEQLIGKTRLGVRKEDGTTTVWYASSTMLQGPS